MPCRPFVKATAPLSRKKPNSDSSLPSQFFVIAAVGRIFTLLDSLDLFMKKSNILYICGREKRSEDQTHRKYIIYSGFTSVCSKSVFMTHQSHCSQTCPPRECPRRDWLPRHRSRSPAPACRSRPDIPARPRFRSSGSTSDCPGSGCRSRSRPRTGRTADCRCSSRTEAWRSPG